MGSRWGGYSACEVSDNAQLSTPWQEVISFFLRGGDVAEDVAGSLGTGWHSRPALRRTVNQRTFDGSTKPCGDAGQLQRDSPPSPQQASGPACT
jgi:hypothetical protein